MKRYFSALNVLFFCSDVSLDICQNNVTAVEFKIWKPVSGLVWR